MLPPVVDQPRFYGAKTNHVCLFFVLACVQQGFSPLPPAHADRVLGKDFIRGDQRGVGQLGLNDQDSIGESPLNQWYF
jgi:hypothetical protein